MLNLNFINDFDPNCQRIGNNFSYSIGRDRLANQSFNFNQNIQNYPALNNILSYSFDDLNQKSNVLESRKSKSKSKESIQSE